MSHLIKSLLIFLILSKCEDVFGRKPNMIPDIEEIHINKGESLKIICNGTKSLKFIYPVNGINPLIITSPVNVTLLGHSGKFSSILHKEETVHGDTGYYGCADDDVEFTPGVYNQTNVRWIYVYVKSIVSGFAEEADFYIYQSHVGDSLLLPCRPTSPNYNVNLFLENEAVKLGENVIFDPRVGFTLKRLTMKQSGSYKCSTQVDDTIHELEFHVTVFKSLHLESPTVFEEPLRHVVRGQTLRVNCSIEADDGIPLTMKWTAPHESSRISEKLYRKQLDLMKMEVIAELQIKDVNDKDQGQYTCAAFTVDSMESTTKNVTMYIHSS